MIEQTNDANENFEQMLDENFKTLHSGEVVTGIVISVSEHEISVNLGSKADGIVARNEVTEDDTIDIRTLFKTGDSIEVYISKINDGEGNVVLSHKRISEKKNFESLEAAFNSKAVVKGKVLDLIKGGLIALINGARVFVPASQATSRYTEDLSILKGQELDFNIIEFDAERRRVLAGRRDLALK
jgi:ribosomal protein S1